MRRSSVAVAEASVCKAIRVTILAKDLQAVGLRERQRELMAEVMRVSGGRGRVHASNASPYRDGHLRFDIHHRVSRRRSLICLADDAADDPGSNARQAEAPGRPEQESRLDRFNTRESCNGGIFESWPEVCLPSEPCYIRWNCRHSYRALPAAQVSPAQRRGISVSYDFERLGWRRGIGPQHGSTHVFAGNLSLRANGGSATGHRHLPDPRRMIPSIACCTRDRLCYCFC